MRDINRIDNFCTDFSVLWKQNFPDWRFGQLCSNFFNWLYAEKKVDLFFPEESKMIEYFREFCGGIEDIKNE